MENLNSVCFISQINEVKPIENSDNIELAIVNGWNCVVKKNLYKVGDLVVCMTTDAVLPKEVADMLEVTSYLRSGNRVRTVKLRNTYSECLVTPLYAFSNTLSAYDSMHVGKDLMSILGIYKYDPPAKMLRLSNGKTRKYHENPNFPIYYKFPNIKNKPNLFNSVDYVEITRKIHGTNARYGIVKKNKLSVWSKIKKFLGFSLGWDAYEFVVGSHNVEKGSESQGFYDRNVWFDIADKYQIKDRLWNVVKNKVSSCQPEDLGSGLVIYGEIYGKGIQKNYEYGLDDIMFFIFDIELDKKYLNMTSAKYMAEDCLGISYAEVLYTGFYSEEIKNTYVFNNFINNTKVPHEGVVIKSIDGDRHKVAKVINPDYLIYGEKHSIGDSH